MHPLTRSVKLLSFQTNQGHCLLRSLIFTTLVFLTGCAGGFHNLPDPGEQMSNGNLNGAEQTFSAAYSPSGKSKLLYHLELGLINHLKGNYQRSNEMFDKAEDISEKLYTQSLSELAATSLTGASFTTYRGFKYEQTLVNYYKALNYLKLAELDENHSQIEIDNALVEIRRLGIKLNEINELTGGYQTQTNGLNNQVLRFFSRMLGNKVDSKALQYKDDAYAHYMSGLFYQIAGEQDSARIEYQKAAQSYEDGFAAQFELDQKSISRTWFDLIKLMKQTKGYEDEWHTLAEQKLTDADKAKLESINPDDSEIVIIQHFGLAPKRKSLDMLLRIDEDSRALVLTPILKGTRAERQSQAQWFYMLYADTDITDIIENYSRGDIGDVIQGVYTKRIPLYGKLWKEAKDLELVTALSRPVRVSVPYIPSLQHKLLKTEVFVDGEQSENLIKGQSLARIALQQQLIIANRQIQAALARELAKAITAQKMIKSVGDDFKGFAEIGLTLVNVVTAEADTRGWLSLPAQINFNRISLAPGQHNIQLKSYLQNGNVITEEFEVNIKSDKPSLLSTRTFDRLPAKPINNRQTINAN